MALLALLVIVTFFYPLLAPTAHRIDQAHFDLIKDGMTKAEVEAILSVRAGKYDWATADEWFVYVGAYEAADQGIGICSLPVIQSAFDSDEPGQPSLWVGRHGACAIHFDHRQRVTARRSFSPQIRIEPPGKNWWAKLRGQQ
jgi:hypothetical protein